MAGIWEDREFVSRFASETVRLQIIGVVPTSDVLVDMVNIANGVPVFDNRIATPEPDGVYALTLGTADTKDPRLLRPRVDLPGRPRRPGGPHVHLGGSGLTHLRRPRPGHAGPRHAGLVALR